MDTKNICLIPCSTYSLTNVNLQQKFDKELKQSMGFMHHSNMRTFYYLALYLKSKLMLIMNICFSNNTEFVSNLETVGSKINSWKSF